MILHPGILSLIAGSGIVILMMAYASLLGLNVLRKWDMNSSSPGQLALERKTYLISGIMNFAFAYMALSIFLFIYTVDDIHTLFIGAMCATGSLNASPVGWKVLYAKMLVFFLSLIWMAFNYIDRRAEDYPLVRMKYAMMLLILPLLLIDAYFQVKYFLGLKPNIITSCCGALFSEYGDGPASTLSSAPIKPMMAVFYSSISLFLLTALLSLISQKSILKYILGFLSLVVLVVSVASIISFVSLYYYQLPTHHCPFDIIQRDYNFIGYPIYISLFSGAFLGMIAGITEPFKKITSLNSVIQKSQKKWTVLSIILISIFTIICSWPILFSSFTLEGYF